MCPSNALGENHRAGSSVMLVDDDQEVLTSLSIFLELDAEHEVVAFPSAQQALDFLEKRPVDLVISDYLMPEMDGLEFLSRVKKMYPETGRILLTGYADKRNAIRGINEVGLFQYIEKPWDNDQLRMIIRNAIANKTLAEKLQEKIGDLDSMLRQRDLLVESQKTLRNELALARKLQQRTLPQSLPKADGFSFAVKYVPALEVGGDFYDIMQLSDDRLAVLLADITGHGIQGALSTTLLKFAFRNFEGGDVSPGEILTGMNSALHLVLPDEIFVAAMVITINVRTSECAIVNGGVSYPVHFSRATQNVRQLLAKGLVLGVVEGNLYRPGDEVRFKLEEGDQLIAYTDGLIEVEDENEQQLGTEWLCDAILKQNKGSCQELLDSLFAAAKGLGRPGYHWDDITIFGIERSKPLS